MRGSASKIKLESYGDLFGKHDLPIVQKVAMQEQVVEIPLAELYEFDSHPFKVLDDEKMEELVQSIKERGVLVPGIARPVGKNRYEIISGHRRKHACELAGLTKMPVFIKEMSDEESTVVMVDANIQREVILPSEKAKAYKMKYDALKHPGIKGEGNTLALVGATAGDSAKTVQRYILLANLVDGLLDMVDDKTIGFIQGTELAYLDEEQQNWVFHFLKETSISIDKEQATKLKEYGKKKELTEPMVKLILSESKPKERKITIKANRIKQYFPEDMSETEIESIIVGLLEEWKNRE